jgi:hypothetical protein
MKKDIAENHEIVKVSSLRRLVLVYGQSIDFSTGHLFKIIMKMFYICNNYEVQAIDKKS